jgi:hypothetical protein
MNPNFCVATNTLPFIRFYALLLVFVRGMKYRTSKETENDILQLAPEDFVISSYNTVVNP